MTRKRNPFAKVPPSHPIAEPGDLFFTRGGSVLSRATRWAEQTHGETRSWANHAGIITRRGYVVPPRAHVVPASSRHPSYSIIGDDSLEPMALDAAGLIALAWVSEALWRVEHHEWWANHQTSAGYEIAVYRVRDFDDKDRRAVVSDALSRSGNKYGWWRLFTFLGETLSNRATFGRLTIPFTRLHFQRTRVVCSNHQARALAAAPNHPFSFGGQDPSEVDPDEGMDYCRAHGGEVELVGRAVVPHPRRSEYAAS